MAAFARAKVQMAHVALATNQPPQRPARTPTRRG